MTNVSNFAIDPSCDESYFCPNTRTVFNQKLTVFQIFSNNTWSVLPAMLFPMAMGTQICFDSQFVVITSAEENWSQVQKFNVTKRIWNAESSMNVGRRFHQSLIIDHYAYVFGGVNHHTEKEVILQSVERLNLIAQHSSWQCVAPMLTPRVEFKAVVYESNVYVFGGERDFFARDHYSDDYKSDYVSSVEKYDIVSNEWRECSPMPLLGWITNVVIQDDNIVVIGQHKQTYDPRCNAWTDSCENFCVYSNIAID